MAAGTGFGRVVGVLRFYAILSKDATTRALIEACGTRKGRSVTSRLRALRQLRRVVEGRTVLQGINHELVAGHLGVEIRRIEGRMRRRIRREGA